MSITLKKFTPKAPSLTVSVPASKSILNRALLLSAFSNGETKLVCGDFGDDTRAMLDCLSTLGAQCSFSADGVLVRGVGGNPKNDVCINVRSAGTAARFLTVALAVTGGRFTLHASAQMAKRPMEIIKLLQAQGVVFDWLEKEGTFPFSMTSQGFAENTVFEVDTDTSTQYASGLLLSAPFSKYPLTVRLTGSRTHGGYVEMSLKILKEFGAKFMRSGDEITVYPKLDAPASYVVEADVSSACYFYALALLFRLKVLVRRIRLDGMQSDLKFLRLLEDKGVIFTQTDEGVIGDAAAVESFTGFDADLNDFSDQTLTCAALAPFATTPSHLKNVEHIKKQECDRITAIVENLTALGVPASTDGENIEIIPSPVQGGTVQTFNDHRVAMSFALIALKTGTVTLDDETCCKKTFEKYFEIIKSL